MALGCVWFRRGVTDACECGYILVNSNYGMTIVTGMHLTRDNPIFKKFLLEAGKASVSAQECRGHVCHLKHLVSKKSLPRALVAPVQPQKGCPLVCCRLGPVFGKLLMVSKCTFQKAWSDTAHKLAFHFSNSHYYIAIGKSCSRA